VSTVEKYTTMRLKIAKKARASIPIMKMGKKVAMMILNRKIALLLMMMSWNIQMIVKDCMTR
jgi:hypothetical protein